MLNFIRQIDYFRKVNKDVVNQKQTSQGGLIACIMLMLLGTLVSYTIINKFNGELLKYPYIDNSNSDERIRVNMNITFQNSPCQSLSVDYQDITGTHLEDIQHSLYKLRLTSKGDFIDKDEMIKIQKFENKQFFPSFPKIFKKTEELNDCYGAEVFKGQKCISCNDVMVAYGQRGWPLPPLEAITQCKSGIFKTEQQIKDDEEYKRKVQEEQKLREQFEKQNIQDLAFQQQQLIEEQQRQHEIILQEQNRRKQEQQKQIEEQSLKQQEQKQQQQQLLQQKELEEKQKTEQESAKKISDDLEKSKQILNQQSSDSLNQDSQNQQINNEKKNDITVGVMTQFQQNHLKQKVIELQELNFNPENFDAQTLTEQKLDRIDDLLAMIQRIIQSQQQKQLGINATRSIIYLQQESVISKIQIYKKYPNDQIQTFQLEYQIQQKNSVQNIKVSDILQSLQINQDQQSLEFTVEFLKRNNKYELLINKFNIIQELEEGIELLELNFIVRPIDNQIEQLCNASILIFPQINLEDISQQQINMKIEEIIPEDNKSENDNKQENNQENDKIETEQNVQPDNPLRNRRQLFAEDYGQEQHTLHTINQDDINKLQKQIGEGCQIFGHMFLKKVPGNFHISYHSKGIAKIFMHQQFSLRHTVNLLEFTTENNNITVGNFLKSTNPIDNQFNELDDGQDLDYYIKIVNTKFENIFKEQILNLYQFTAMKSKKVVNPDMAAVTFKYEFDPISMRYFSQKQTIVQFIISMCAIIGGVFSISKFFHQLFG